MWLPAIENVLFFGVLPTTTSKSFGRWSKYCDHVRNSSAHLKKINDNDLVCTVLRVLWQTWVHRILHFGFPFVSHVRQTISLIHVSKWYFLTFLWWMLNISKSWIIHNSTVISSKDTELLKRWKCFWLLTYFEALEVYFPCKVGGS